MPQYNPNFHGRKRNIANANLFRGTLMGP